MVAVNSCDINIEPLHLQRDRTTDVRQFKEGFLLLVQHAAQATSTSGRLVKKLLKPVLYKDMLMFCTYIEGNANVCQEEVVTAHFQSFVFAGNVRLSSLVETNTERCCPGSRPSLQAPDPDPRLIHQDYQEHEEC